MPTEEVTCLRTDKFCLDEKKIRIRPFPLDNSLKLKGKTLFQLLVLVSEGGGVATCKRLCVINRYCMMCNVRCKSESVNMVLFVVGVVAMVGMADGLCV